MISFAVTKKIIDVIVVYRDNSGIFMLLYAVNISGSSPVGAASHHRSFKSS
jgi:hypothetical protein